MSTIGHGTSGGESDNVGPWICRLLERGSSKNNAPSRSCAGANASGERFCGTCHRPRQDGLWVKVGADGGKLPLATSEEVSVYWSKREPVTYAPGMWQCRLRWAAPNHAECDHINGADANVCQSEFCGRPKTENLYYDPPGCPPKQPPISAVSPWYWALKTNPGLAIPRPANYTVKKA